MDGARASALGEITLTAVLWGTSFPIINYGIAIGLSPTTFAFLRFAIAAPLMFVVARWLGQSVFEALKMKEVWLLGVLNGCGFLFQFLGQASTNASVASLLVNMSFLTTAVLSAAYLNERFGTGRVAGLVLALAGAVLVTTEGNLELVTRGQLLGDAFCLASAIVWGIYIVFDKQKTDEKKWDPVSVSGATVVVTAVFLAPAAALGGTNSIGPAGWEVIGYTVVLNTVLPFILYQRSLRFISATTSAVVQMLEIVSAVAISVVFLGEVLEGAVSVGAILILVSIALVSSSGSAGKSLSVAPTSPRGEAVG